MRFIKLVVSDKGSRPSFQNGVSSRYPGTNELIFSFIQITHIAWVILGIIQLRVGRYRPQYQGYIANDTSQNYVRRKCNADHIIHFLLGANPYALGLRSFVFDKIPDDVSLWRNM